MKQIGCPIIHVNGDDPEVRLDQGGPKSGLLWQAVAATWYSHRQIFICFVVMHALIFWWDELQIKFLEAHTYFTKTAIELRRENKNARVEEVKARLKAHK